MTQRPVAHLRASLRVAEDLPRLEPREPERIQQSVRALLNRWEAGEARPREETKLAYILDVVRRHWSMHRTLEGMLASVLRRASWVLFFPPADPASWLGADPEFVAAYVGWLKGSRNASALNGTIRAFLQAYPREAPTFDTWCREIRAAVKSFDDLRSLRWRQRHDQYALFEAHGHAALAKHYFTALCSPGSDPERFLESVGLVGLSQSSKFLECVTERTLALLEQALSSREALGSEALERIVALVVRPDLSWRLPQLRVALATALLRPFVDSDPDEERRLEIERILLRFFKDPRLAVGPWSGVPETCVVVLKRWLAGKTFELFFEILARTADRKDHWEERLKFWSAYLDRGQIPEAWVILGPEAQREARKLARHTNLAFGELRAGSGVHKSHSVLLMKIVGPWGHAVVTEWSHLGSCRIWSGRLDQQPAFYRNRYDRDDLTSGATESVPHVGYWKARLQDTLRKLAGV